MRDVRIVSLTCSNTEIVDALGCAGQLVGVDNHSDYPADVVAALPRVGPDLDIDVARVAALRPDLVLASLTVPGHERIIERLTRAGLPFLVSEPTSVADVYADVLRLGNVLGVPDRASVVVARMSAEMVPSKDASPGARPCVLVEWWPKPVIVPGRFSWVTEMLAVAGGKGVLDGEPVKSRPVTDGEVRAWSPDAVVVAWCGVPFGKYRPDVVRRRAGWRGTAALAEDRIYSIPEAFLGRPGPRLVDGVRALRRVVAACR